MIVSLLKYNDDEIDAIDVEFDCLPPLGAEIHIDPADAPNKEEEVKCETFIRRCGGLCAGDFFIVEHILLHAWGGACLLVSLGDNPVRDLVKRDIDKINYSKMQLVKK